MSQNNDHIVKSFGDELNALKTTITQMGGGGNNAFIHQN